MQSHGNRDTLYHGHPHRQPGRHDHPRHFHTAEGGRGRLLRRYQADPETAQPLRHHRSRPSPSTPIHRSTESTAAIALLLEGKSIAYATDSGTPGSPIRAAGSSPRPATAPSRSAPYRGRPPLRRWRPFRDTTAKRMLFAGFLSKKEGRRKKELMELRGFGGLIILYESPYRIKKLLQRHRGSISRKPGPHRQGNDQIP